MLRFASLMGTQLREEDCDLGGYFPQLFSGGLGRSWRKGWRGPVCDSHASTRASFSGSRPRGKHLWEPCKDAGSWGQAGTQGVEPGILTFHSFTGTPGPAYCRPFPRTGA